MSKKFAGALALSLAVAPLFACFADTIEEEFVVVRNGVRFEYGQKLRDLKVQINTGVDKGWINSDQASTLMAEHDRLVGEMKKDKQAGWPKEQTDQLEKDVTAFSAKVSTTLSKSTAKPASGGHSGH
jgi:hypothetical protein